MYIIRGKNRRKVVFSAAPEVVAVSLGVCYGPWPLFAVQSTGEAWLLKRFFFVLRETPPVTPPGY